MALISDNVDGINVAPAAPCNARAAISISGVRENAAATEATPKKNAPHNNKRRRPIRSPTVPMVTNNAATTNAYTSTTHSIWVAEG